jgi:RNase adaptor protein for sRNA GlmZ degradation
MPIVEVGGLDSSRKPSRLEKAVTVHAHHLINPWRAIKKHEIDNTTNAIEAYIRAHGHAKKFDKVVNVAIKALCENKHVRIVCRAGRHRSQAVARRVISQLPHMMIELNFLEEVTPVSTVAQSVL